MSATQFVQKVGKGNIKVWDVTLTVATGATTASVTSADYFSGKIAKVEIDPGTLKATATIKGYEASTPLATGTRDHFLSYTVPNPAVEVAFYPHLAGALNTGAAANPTLSLPYIVCDKLTIDLAGANAADVVRVRVYVNEG